MTNLFTLLLNINTVLILMLIAWFIYVFVSIIKYCKEPKIRYDENWKTFEIEGGY